MEYHVIADESHFAVWENSTRRGRLQFVGREQERVIRQGLVSIKR